MRLSSSSKKISRVDEVVQALVDVAIELRRGRVGGVADVMEAGIGADAAKQVGQGLIGGDGGCKFRPGEAGQPAPPFLGEELRVAVGARDVAAQRG